MMKVMKSGVGAMILAAVGVSGWAADATPIHVVTGATGNIAADASISQRTSDRLATAFRPRPSSSTSLDYSMLDVILDDMVLDMGPSLRRRAPYPEAETGTRLSYGHTSPYRLEGSRFAFESVDDAFRQGLRDYLADLQSIGTTVDIASLSRTEQLSYWINLHNVAVLSTISDAYPVTNPSAIDLDVDGVDYPFDEAPIFEVSGKRFSLKDLRTRIVFPNWPDNPEVIYAFYRGDIGGPALPSSAMTPRRLSYWLSRNTNEYINSLRGFQADRSGKSVSKIYWEASEIYFPDFDKDLTAHLASYAAPELVAEIAAPGSYDAIRYETMIGDLSGARGSGASARKIFNVTEYGPVSQPERFASSTLRTLRETSDKFIRLRQNGIDLFPGGTVTITDIPTDGPDGD